MSTHILHLLRTAQLDSKGIQYGETHLIVGKVLSRRSAWRVGLLREETASCERNRELLLGESGIMHAILDFVGDNYFPIIDKITEELEAIEEISFRRCRQRKRLSAFTGLRAGLLNTPRSRADD